MGLNWNAAFASAFESGSSMLGDSIKRERDLGDRQALLKMNDDMEQAKVNRIRAQTAELVKSVDTTGLSEADKAQAVQTAAQKAGRLDVAEHFGKEAKELRATNTAEKHYADEKNWRAETARITEEYHKGQLSLQQAQLAISRLNAQTSAASAGASTALTNAKLDELKQVNAGREKVRGLLSAANDVQDNGPGAAESRKFYTDEADRTRAQNAQLYGGADEKLRYQMGSIDDPNSPPDPITGKRPQIDVSYDRQTGDVRPIKTPGGARGAEHVYASADELKAAIASGKVKSGATVQTVDGPRKVK